MRRKTALILGSLGALLVVAALGAAVRAGIVPAALPDPRPTGPFVWTLSRALGVTAYVAISLEVVLGLALSTGAGDRLIARARSVELHEGLSATAIAITAAHAIALVGDRFVRFDVIDLIVPFASRVRPLGVGLGVLAAWAAVLVHASFAARKRLGPRGWRAMHYLAFALYAAATAHGLLAGTDARATWLRAVYATSVVAVLSLTGLRIARSIARRAVADPAGESAAAGRARAGQRSSEGGGAVG